MDLDYDLSCAPHTPEILEKKIRMLAEHGFERLHIVAPPPGNPDYSHAARVVPENGPPNFLRQSRAAFKEEPLKLAVDFAKKAGLKVIIVFKPYEGGGAFTIPHNTLPPCGQNYMETLGGRAVGLDPFIVEHPEFLVARKPFDTMRQLVVTKIKLIFIADHIGDDDNANESPSLADDNIISRFPASAFKLYTSYDNGVYNPVGTPFMVEEHIEQHKIINANGDPVFPQPVQCRIITISGLKIDAPYFAVDFEGDEKAFRTIPFSMCRAYNEKEEIPVTVSPTARHGALEETSAFRQHGFEFEEIGPYYWDCGWKSGTLFGFARGKLKYLRGSLCEAYPEVRQHWLEQVRHYLTLGADGIEIRLQSHCSGVTDFANYNFNPPLVDAYRKKYGKDILNGTPDMIKLMEIRGDFFAIFIHDVRTLLKQHKRKLLLQLHDYMEHPVPNTSFHDLGFWANPKILPDWRKLVEAADEVIIKDYNFGSYKPEVANHIKDLTVAMGKPLWIHCYLQQGHDWNRHFREAVENDSRITGLLLYEVVWNDRENDGIVEVKDHKLVWKLKN